MLFFIVILACGWIQVFGQANPCPCVPAGSCPTPGAAGIDIRIVNNGGNVCPPGYVQCCTNTTPTPPIPDYNCGVRKIQPTPQTVIGQASFGAYPWIVALLGPDGKIIGSGALIDSNHVLTAAHKVSAYVNNPMSLTLRMGEWNTMKTDESYPHVQFQAAKITSHPNFNPKTVENDVAVIKLQGSVHIPSYPNINTICAPASAPPTGIRCYVAGWGKNQFGPNGAFQNIMREVDVPIIDSTDCENRLRLTRLGASYMLNKMSFMCAGGELGKDACEGDGGAPLVCQNAIGQWTVYGMVAWGIGCANSNVPGVYTNVFNFWSWINNIKATM